MLFSCRGVALGAHHSHLAIVASRYIHYYYCVSIFIAVSGGIYQNIAGLNVLDGAWASLMVERIGAAKPIHISHIRLESLA